MTRSQYTTTARTKARRRAVDVLFEADQRGGYTPEKLQALLRDRIIVTAAQTALPQYSVDIVTGVAEHLNAIDEILSTYLEGWTLDRIPSVDRAILRASTWELLKNDEVDAAVTITQAVTLAAELSTDESPAFVNALLDRLAALAPVLRVQMDTSAHSPSEELG